MTDPTPPLPPMPPPSWRYRMAVMAALIVAAIALYAGVRATETGEDEPQVGGRPGVVEHIIPREAAEALHQSEIGIDLAPGYEGRLILNGTAIPTDELRLVPEQNQVYFAPAQGKTFEALPSGRNCVVAVVWKSSAGPGTPADLSYRWCFDVT